MSRRCDREGVAWPRSLGIWTKGQHGQQLSLDETMLRHDDPLRQRELRAYDIATYDGRSVVTKHVDFRGDDHASVRDYLRERVMLP